MSNGALDTGEFSITPRIYIKNRVSALRDALSSNEVDAVFIMNPANVEYLSGFTGGDSYILITHDKALLITDFRYITQAKIESGEGTEDVKVDCEVFSYEIVRVDGTLADLLADILRDNNVESLFVEEDFISHSVYKNFVDKLPVKNIHDLGNIVSDLRAVKDEHEISLIQKAIDIADKAFERIVEFVKPGVSEKDVADELLYYLNKCGAEGVSFDIISVSGPRTAMPHGKPSFRKILENDIITLDFGAKFRGYCSDITRTFFVGKPSDDLINIYNVVNDARQLAINEARAGVSGKELDLVARGFIEEKGFGEFFGHGLGHGVGLEIHEAPAVNKRNGKPIKAGSVVTIEPGIYIENLGGVRIEDVILVKDSDCEVLTGTSRELLIL